MKNAEMNITKGMHMNETAGIPARAVIEVHDTSNNKWIMLTSVAWITWNFSKGAKENNNFN